MKTILMSPVLLLLLLCNTPAAAQQTNTASNSGSIGKCGVWDYPYTLYNNAGASQIVNDGVTVTVDQNRNIGAVNLSGSGAMAMSGANGITFSGSGSQINCRWDIPARGSYAIVNNNNNTNVNAQPLNTGVFFTAPYTGDYVWVRGNSGWAASVSGAHLNANLLIFNDASGLSSSIFFQNQAGSCGMAGGAGSTALPAQWIDSLGPSLTAGTTLSYRAGTAYGYGPACNNTTFNFSIGQAVVVYDN